MPARLGTAEGRPPAKWLADLRKARVRTHSRGVPCMAAQCCCKYTALTSIPWTTLLQDDAAKGLRAQVTIADIGAISHSYRRHPLCNVSMDHKQLAAAEPPHITVSERLWCRQRQQCEGADDAPLRRGMSSAGHRSSRADAHPIRDIHAPGAWAGGPRQLAIHFSRETSTGAHLSMINLPLYTAHGANI